VGDPDVTLATKNNNKDLGVDEGIALTGKLAYMPWKDREDKGLHFGLAVTHRTPMTDDVAGQMRFNTRVVSKINRKKYIDSDYIKNIEHELATNAEFAAYYRGLKVSAEQTNADVARNDGLATVKFRGAFVQAAAMLFGGKYIYNSSEGEFTESRLGRSWGDAELAVRYEMLDMNSKEAGVMGGAGEAWTIGLNVFPNRNVKFMLNWSLVNNDRYANGRGKLYIGHDAKGLLTKDPLLAVESDGKAGEDFSVLGVRVQVSF
jgi:phosphate-selective porin OprO/OprP